MAICEVCGDPATWMVQDLVDGYSTEYSCEATEGSFSETAFESRHSLGLFATHGRHCGLFPCTLRTLGFW